MNRLDDIKARTAEVITFTLSADRFSDRELQAWVDLQQEVSQVCQDRAFLLDLVTDSQYLLASVIVTAGYAMSPAWHAAAKELLERMGAGYGEGEE